MSRPLKKSKQSATSTGEFKKAHTSIAATLTKTKHHANAYKGNSSTLSYSKPLTSLPNVDFLLKNVKSRASLKKLTSLKIPLTDEKIIKDRVELIKISYPILFSNTEREVDNLVRDDIVRIWFIYEARKLHFPYGNSRFLFLFEKVGSKKRQQALRSQDTQLITDQNWTYNTKRVLTPLLICAHTDMKLTNRDIGKTQNLTFDVLIQGYLSPNFKITSELKQRLVSESRDYIDSYRRKKCARHKHHDIYLSLLYAHKGDDVIVTNYYTESDDAIGDLDNRKIQTFKAKLQSIAKSARTWKIGVLIPKNSTARRFRNTDNSHGGEWYDTTEIFYSCDGKISAATSNGVFLGFTMEFTLKHGIWRSGTSEYYRTTASLTETDGVERHRMHTQVYPELSNFLPQVPLDLLPMIISYLI